jgi:hypothetical protein
LSFTHWHKYESATKTKLCFHVWQVVQIILINTNHPDQKISKASSSSSSKLKMNMMMRRPKTPPEQSRHSVFNEKMNHPMEALGANKLSVNVTAAQSIGPLRILLSGDATVEDVIKSTLLLYAKEGRRPLLSNDPACFALHYSQFSIHCLKPVFIQKMNHSIQKVACSILLYHPTHFLNTHF